MFFNLNAEMARSKLTQSDLARVLNLNSSTISDKMNGKRDFWLLECKKIRDSFFPQLTIDYLFQIENN